LSNYKNFQKNHNVNSLIILILKVNNYTQNSINCKYVPSFPRKRESQLSQNQPISKNTLIVNLILYGIILILKVNYLILSNKSQFKQFY